MASTFLTRTAGSAVAAERKKYTISVWVKRSTVGVEHAVCSAGNGGGSEEFTIRFDSTDKLNCFHYNGSSMVGQLITNRLFRDVNAWYHIYFVYDSANSTQADRFMLYINGERETSFSTNTGLTQNDLSPWNVDERHQIGSNSWANSGNGNGIFDGVMSHFYNVAGSHIAVTEFGSTDSTTGEWKINTSPTISSYGTDGFLVLKDGNTATDQSPNSNNFTITGSLTKTEDCPSNIFATLNPLTYSATKWNLEYGNLRTNGLASGEAAAWRSVYGTLGASSGKYYFEMKVTRTDSNATANIGVGIVDAEQMKYAGDNDTFYSQGSRAYGYQGSDGNKMNNNTSASYGATFLANDIIGCAFDLDNHKIYWSKNGVWQNSGYPTSGSTGTGSAFDLATGYTYLPAVTSYYDDDRIELNFGNGYFGTSAISSAGTNASNNGIFEYDVPTGYTALSTKGLNL